MYLKYKEHRPIDTLNESHRFFLGINHSKQAKSWYTMQNMGVNKIGSFARNMAEKAGISGRITNHSARHTLVTSLSKAGVEHNDIIKVTGHKTIEGLKSYRSMDLDDRRILSDKIQASTYGESSSLNVTPISTIPEANARINWSNLTQTSSSCGLFSGATIQTVNINYNYQHDTCSKAKKPRVLYSDSESE